MRKLFSRSSRYQSQSAGCMGCAASAQTRISQPEGPSAAEIEAKRLAEVARLEKLVAETGGSSEPAPGAPARARTKSGRHITRADKMAARAAEAKQRKSGSLSGQAAVASKLIALKKQARKNIATRNKQLAKMAPAEVSSDSEDEEIAPDQSEDPQPVQTGLENEATGMAAQSHTSLASGDSLRTAEVDPGTV